MTSLKKIIYIFFLLCLSYCSEEDYIEIESMVKTEFNVNENQKAYFKYKLGEEKGPIGLHFHLANLYTVKVSIFKNLEEEAFLSYLLAENQFKEINTTGFDEYVYILIEETYKYFYKDYITIYDPKKIIELKPEEPLIINNFLSNNKYEMSFYSEDNITLVYNTNNTENNKRLITIKYENETIIDKEDVSQYKLALNPGEINIIVENLQEIEDEEKIMKTDFSLIVYEIKNEYGFNEVIQDSIKKTKYIYNNEKQEFYYYVDISKYDSSNTLNFKLNFKYFLLQNYTKFLTNIIYLDEEISDTDFVDNLPIENKLPFSYDEDSDEFLRIYFKDENNDKKYKYLLVKVEIEDIEYYIGSKEIEVSLGNQAETIELNDIAYNEAYTIDKKLTDYIPIYLNLVLDPNEIYLLTSQYEDLTLFIKGDLLDENNEINKNYLYNTNEIIILKDIDELTIRIFGSTTKELIYYIQKVEQKKLIYAENERNNEIFSITEANCKSGETIYVLGTYDYESYAYGELAVNYYATVDSGSYEVYYTNNISLNEESLFPLENNKIDFDVEIPLNNNKDLFTIKCKEAGLMSIRPVYKDFDETTHLIEQNSINNITLFDRSEIIQLSTLLGQKEGIAYFSILSLDGDEINISPDTEGLFDNKNIKDNELFSGSANLSKYKMDQLAIRVNCSSLEKNIEVIEKIPNKYNAYTKISKGKNKNITLYNIYIEINDKTTRVDIEFENLKNKKIAYGIIQTASNDSNYLLTTDKYYDNYPNIEFAEINDNNKKINCTNIYRKKSDKKPNLFCLVSILDQNDDDLNYNAKVEVYKDEDVDDSSVLIVFILLLSAIILGFVILAIYMVVVKRKAAGEDIQDDKEEKLFSQNMKSEVDP